MFFSKYKIVAFVIISITLSACGGGLSGVDNNHPSQYAPKTAPDISVKRNEKNQLIIDWPEQQNSEKYVLYISSSENFESDKTSTTTVTKPPYIIDELEAGLNYHVKIRPSWETKAGPESNTVTLISPPIAPQNVDITEASLITWENESASFNVYWSKDPDFTIGNAEGSEEGITAKSYQPSNHDYKNDDLVYFIVTAINDDVESAVSDKIQIAASDLIEQAISPPNTPKITVSNGIFNLEWPPVVTADNYNVYMAQDMGVNQENATSLAGGMTHSNEQSPFGHGLANGSRYYLVVTAKNNKNEESVESTELSIKPKTTIPGVPNNISIEADKDHLTLSWAAVDNAISYNVYASTTPNVTAKPELLVPGGSDITNTNLIHTGLQNGLMYYYVVTAILSTGESEESAEVGAIPYGLLAQPTDIQTQEANKQISISWPDVPGAENYHLYMAFENSLTKDNIETLEGWMKHTKNVTSPFVHPGLINDQTYYMRLTAIDKFGKESIESALFEATPHADPGNQPPNINVSIIDQTATENEPFIFQFSDSTFLDPDDDPLTYSAAQHTLTNLPDWLNFDSATRTFSGTPLNTHVGELDIDLTAIDNNGNIVTDVFKIVITNVNNNPTAMEIPAQIAIVGSTFNYQIIENTFNDIDVGDTLSISTATLPDWLNFNNTTQTFSGTPVVEDIGSLNLNVTANDNNGGTVSTPLQLTVINTLDTPLAVDDNPEEIAEGGSKIISVLSNDLQANNPLKPSSVTVIKAPSHGTFAVNITDGAITYTHNGDETTTDSFTYSVKDSAEKTSNEAIVSIKIKPINDAPIITGTPSTSVNAGESYIFTPIATDLDNSLTELTFSIVNKPDWASFNENTGELSGTPPASAFDTTTSGIEISVSDGSLPDTLLPAFDISVTGTPPQAKNDTGEIIAAGNSVLIPMLDNDTPNASLNRSSIEITKTPTNGTATPDGNGNVIYQSTSPLDTSDSFTYTVKDKIGLVSNEAIVNINVIPWASMDILDPTTTAIPGEFKEITPGKYTVSGSGVDIWDNADSFHYAYKPIIGDVDISVQVTNIENLQTWVKAGIMLRETLDTGSKHVNLFATANLLLPLVKEYLQGMQFQARIKTNDLSGGYTSRFNGTSFPQHIRLTRRGDTFNAFESSSGQDWQLIGSINIPMNQTIYAGLAVTSNFIDQVSTATFENLSLIEKNISSPSFKTVNFTNQPFNQSINKEGLFYKVTNLVAGKTYNVNVISSAGEDINLQAYDNAFNLLECQSFLINVSYDACLATANTNNELYIRVDGSYTNSGTDFNLSLTEWTPKDIGTLTEGYNDESASAYPYPNKDKYLIAGSGVDIFNLSDGFRYFYQKISGDIEIIARVSSQVNTHDWAKAGVMIRETDDPSSKFVDVMVTPAPINTKGVRFQSRVTATTGSVIHNNTRTNNVATPRWVRLVRRGNTFDAYESFNGVKWLFIGSTHVSMNQDVLVGLAVTSHDDGVTSEAVFENVQVFNHSGTPFSAEPVSAPLSNQLFSVDSTDKLLRVTGLIPNTTYTVDLTNLTDDADLYVYTDNFESLQCPDITSYSPAHVPEEKAGTTSEKCQGVTSTNNNELYIRVNGSYTSNGANFRLTVTQE